MEQVTMATRTAWPVGAVRHGPEDDDEDEDEHEGESEGEDGVSTRTDTPIHLRPSPAGPCWRRRP